MYVAGSSMLVEMPRSLVGKMEASSPPKRPCCRSRSIKKP
jgi:hypothetical protein